MNGMLSVIDSSFAIYSDEGFWIQCDEPLGIIMVKEKAYWIVRDLGYKGESFVIFDVTQASVRKILSVYAGGC